MRGREFCGERGEPGLSVASKLEAAVVGQAQERAFDAGSVRKGDRHGRADAPEGGADLIELCAGKSSRAERVDEFVRETIAHGEEGNVARSVCAQCVGERSQ